MKPSKYNFFFPYEPDPSKVIAYNSLSSSLALMEIDKYAAFESFCKDRTSLLDDQLTEDLRRGLFLLQDHIDELELLRFNMYRSRFSTVNLGLTIAPTSDCNFRCIYCYEKDVITPVYMSEEVQDQIIEYVKSHAATITSLGITWYGGEPLLAFDVVEALSRRLIALCQEHEIHYSAGMITNGYLLSREKLAKFEELKITFIQVTIDGTPETHNQRRPCQDGSATFDTIMSNLKDNVDLLPRVSLRINVDKSNLDAGEAVQNYLLENDLRSKVSPHFGKTSNDNNCYDAHQCLNTCEFAKAEADYAARVSLTPDESIKYPAYRSNFCGADAIGGLVINANGDLYKCWSDIGNPDRCVGSLIDDKETGNNTLIDYMTFDPTMEEPCRACNLLPVCMGGCPYRRMSGDVDNCTTYRYILDECLSHAAKVLKAQKDQSAETIEPAAI